MGETGVNRFPGNLDPRAQEFRPTTVSRPPQVYYPYAPPPPTMLPPYPLNDVQFARFGDAGGMGYYAHYPTHPQMYVSASGGPGATPCSSRSNTVGGVSLPPPSGGPTRTLVLSSVAGNVSETVVRMDLEVFGEVRGVQMERVMEGIVTVHFYDLRHAEMAFKEMREQHMQMQQQSYRLKNPYGSGMTLVSNHNNSVTGYSDGNEAFESLLMSSYGGPLLCPPARGLIAGRPVCPQFVIPTCNAVPGGKNQGTIVLFNLDSGVSSATLKEIFQAFGPVKELRETPFKKHQRFIEYYDVRDAAKALKEMNGQEVYGKPIVVEFSRPGGHSKKFFYANYANPTTCTGSNYHTRHSDYPPPPLPPPQPSCYRSPSFISSEAPYLRKKSHSISFRENPNSLEAAMTSLSLGNAIDQQDGRNSKKFQSNHHQSSIASSTAANNRPQQAKARSKAWKGKQAKKFDTRFLISEEAMEDSSTLKDPRTTIMIKNIPNKYSQKLLLNMLDNHCIHCNEQLAEGDDQPLSSYDFVYLPIDFNNKCNVGYGFVNMTTPEATWRLYKAFHHQNWEVFNSRKICEVTYARVQGLEALKEHFKNSKFPSEMDHYLPVVFSPPRDGRQLTEPLPIVGLQQLQSMSIIGHSIANPDDRQTHHLLIGNLTDGSDTLDNNGNSSDADFSDQTHLLMGSGSTSTSSTNGGGCDVVVDDGDEDDREM